MISQSYFLRCDLYEQIPQTASETYLLKLVIISLLDMRSDLGLYLTDITDSPAAVTCHVYHLIEIVSHSPQEFLRQVQTTFHPLYSAISLVSADIVHVSLLV